MFAVGTRASMPALSRRRRCFAHEKHEIYEWKKRLGLKTRECLSLIRMNRNVFSQIRGPALWMNSITPVSTAVTAFGRITIVVDCMSKVGDSLTKISDCMTLLWHKTVFVLQNTTNLQDETGIPVQRELRIGNWELIIKTNGRFVAKRVSPVIYFPFVFLGEAPSSIG